MDEQRYLHLTDDAFRKIIDAFADIDGDDADLEPKGDVLVIRFRDGSRCVVNTQRPVRQLWLAGANRGWHFSFDEASGKWLDDKGSGDELFSVIAALTKRTIGVELTIGSAD